MPKSTKISDDCRGNMQNAAAEISKQKLFMSTLNFRTSLGRCTEMPVPVTKQITT